MPGYMRFQRGEETPPRVLVPAGSVSDLQTPMRSYQCSWIRMMSAGGSASSRVCVRALLLCMLMLMIRMLYIKNGGVGVGVDRFGIGGEGGVASGNAEAGTFRAGGVEGVVVLPLAVDAFCGAVTSTVFTVSSGAAAVSWVVGGIMLTSTQVASYCVTFDLAG